VCAEAHRLRLTVSFPQVVVLKVLPRLRRHEHRRARRRGIFCRHRRARLVSSRGFAPVRAHDSARPLPEGLDLRCCSSTVLGRRCFVELREPCPACSEPTGFRDGYATSPPGERPRLDATTTDTGYWEKWSGPMTGDRHQRNLIVCIQPGTWQRAPCCCWHAAGNDSGAVAGAEGPTKGVREAAGPGTTVVPMCPLRT